MAKLKILMINYEYPPLGGGAGIANRNLLNQYANTPDLSVDLLTSFAGKGMKVETIGQGVRIFKVGIDKQHLHKWKKSEVIAWLFKASKVHRKLLNDNSYDLTHCFFAFPSGLPAWFMRGKCPYIVSLRGSDVPGYNDKLGLDYFLLSGLFKSIWTHSKRVVANSEGLKELASNFFDSAGISVIPNGVVRDQFKFIDRSLTCCKVRLLMVVRFVYRKRVDIAIKTIVRLGEMGIDAELNLVGSGELENTLKRLAAESKVHNKVHFKGSLGHEQLPEVYAENDIYLMCSENEGMSNSMLEAISTGMPVVTSNCEGAKELVCDNGIRVHSQNPDIYADCISKIITEPRLYEQMSKQSDLIAEQFSIDSSANSYLKLYRDVINEMGM